MDFIQKPLTKWWWNTAQKVMKCITLIPSLRNVQSQKKSWKTSTYSKFSWKIKVSIKMRDSLKHMCSHMMKTLTHQTFSQEFVFMISKDRESKNQTYSRVWNQCLLTFQWKSELTTNLLFSHNITETVVIKWSSESLIVLWRCESVILIFI